jgi:hypothetical protein
MTRPFLLLCWLLFVAAPATAQPAVAPAAPAAQAALMRPLTLVKLRDMDFGALGVLSAGSATINPVTEALTVTGGVVRLGGTPRAARFAGSTSSSAVVIIRIPNGAVALTRVGGTETLRADNFKLDGQSKRTMAQAGVFEFNVGASVFPVAGQVEGTYSGTFEVTIQYP